MNSAIERLLNLRVGEVMGRNVVTVPAHQSMGAAATTLLERSIGGAPVIDEQGRCCGILSAGDYVRREAGKVAEAAESLDSQEHRLLHERTEVPYHVETVADDLVQSHASQAVQTVSAETSLIDAARIMCAEHIHRLPVLDDESKPAGMLTAMDIVAAVIHAIEE